jgi:hypothetical protein
MSKTAILMRAGRLLAQVAQARAIWVSTVAMGSSRKEILTFPSTMRNAIQEVRFLPLVHPMVPVREDARRIAHVER